jgi:hypothetical protein
LDPLDSSRKDSSGTKNALGGTVQPSLPDTFKVVVEKDLTDDITCICVVLNLFLVAYIFGRQRDWEVKQNSLRSQERHNQMVREGRAFWMEEVVLRGSISQLHHLLAEYGAKLKNYPQTEGLTDIQRGSDIRAWAGKIDELRLCLIEPGMHVSPKEFEEISRVFEELNDLVSNEFARNAGLDADSGLSTRTIARFNVLRNALNALLFRTHMQILADDSQMAPPEKTKTRSGTGGDSK